MKTKTLLITSLLSLAGGSSLMAQVYSQNVVGYVNVSVQGDKFQLISNPLKAGGNTLGEILPVAPADTILYKLTGSGFSLHTYFEGYGWDPETTLAPGEGVFIYPTASTNLTFVGEVLTGALANPIPNGFSIRASQVPQGASLTALQFPAVGDDLVYVFNTASQSYSIYTYFDGYGWDPGDINGPTINPGQSFFVNKQGATSWARNFTP